MRAMRLRAICFDLDDTLWDVWPAITRAEQRLFDWLADHYPRVAEHHDIASMRARRMAVAAEFPDRMHDLTFLRTESLRRHLVEAGYPAEAAHDAFEVFFAVRNEVVPYADVMPALQRLSTRFRLLSLTNGNADLSRIGLASFFEHSLGAREAGAAKPDPRIFALLLERAGLAPDEVLHVGDDPHADVEGARAVGIPVVWINRGAMAWPGHLAEPDWVVADLSELADQLLDRVP